MSKKKETKEKNCLPYNVGDVIKRYCYRKDLKRKIVVTGFVDQVQVTKHKNPFLDKCYHIVWNNNTQGWWSQKTLESRVLC